MTDTAEMPRYQCHKKVWALKIARIDYPTKTGGAIIHPADEGYAAFAVSADYVRRHHPLAGGYYVVYEGDGYKSYSPAQAFEAGYTRL